MAGIYIHIPFCAKRCVYCDFYSNTNIGYKDGFVSALIREMELRSDYLHNHKIETIYFGGGTPSQLQPSDFERLFEAIYRLFPVSASPEITLESNPDDLSAGYIASLSALPFNRVSIGIQSFVDEELRFLNRRHTAAEAIDAVYRCKDAGMENISIDLIYGLPEQTRERWLYNVKKAIELDVPHISAYNLTYEEGTAIYKMKERGDIRLVDDESCELLFRCLVEQLTGAGFVHYETSNFARQSANHPEGRISLHNSSYWNGTHYLGLGPSAHSYDGDSRCWNVASVYEYIKSIKEQDKVISEVECLDERTKYNDFVITRLRTMWGVSLDELRGEFGEEREQYFLEKSKPFIFLNKLKKQEGFVKITIDGVFISDAIMRELIAL